MKRMDKQEVLRRYVEVRRQYNEHSEVITEKVRVGEMVNQFIAVVARLNFTSDKHISAMIDISLGSQVAPGTKLYNRPIKDKKTAVVVAQIFGFVKQVSDHEQYKSDPLNPRINVMVMLCAKAIIEDCDKHGKNWIDIIEYMVVAMLEPTVEFDCLCIAEAILEKKIGDEDYQSFKCFNDLVDEDKLNKAVEEFSTGTRH